MDEEEEEVERNKEAKRDLSRFVFLGHVLLRETSNFRGKTAKLPRGGFPFNGSQFTNFPRANFT